MPHILIWIISAISILLMLLRPFKTPEFVWVSAGALLLCLLRLIPFSLAGKAVAEGLDVYLFLTGMMLLSELAKDYGVFAWMAHYAVRSANRSSMRLFTSIFAVGVVVTIFMSNDATAVVLTPAVLTAVKRAKAPPLPYLFSCALVANAASFVLPISNPANLVVFNSTMPPLLRWLAMFSIPSLVAIIIKQYVMKRGASGDNVLLFEVVRHLLQSDVVVRLARFVCNVAKSSAGRPGIHVIARLATDWRPAQDDGRLQRMIRQFSRGMPDP